MYIYTENKVIQIVNEFSSFNLLQRHENLERLFWMDIQDISKTQLFLWSLPKTLTLHLPLFYFLKSSVILLFFLLTHIVMGIIRSYLISSKPRYKKSNIQKTYFFLKVISQAPPSKSIKVHSYRAKVW